MSAGTRVLRYDGMPVGTEFQESEVEMSAETLRRYAESIDDDGLMAEAAAGPGTPVSDYSVFILFAITRHVVAKDGEVPAGGVLARQDVSAVRPVRVGDVVRTRARVHEKYERRGRRYLVLRCSISDSAGDPLGTVDNHIIWAR